MKNIFFEKITANCHKKEQCIKDDLFSYCIKSMIAGSLLTLTTFAGAVAGDNINTLHPSLGKFTFAFLFAFGLVYILYTGVELATSNMMYMSAGYYYKKTTIINVLKVIFLSLFFNLIGALLTGFLVNQTATLHYINESSMLVSIVSGKLSHSSYEIFTGAILANIFVNIAILSYLLIENDMARIVSILSAIFMFVYLGLDHVVANFGSFSLMMFNAERALVEGFNVLNVIRQWTFAFLGNLVGGGLFVGIVYAYLNKEK